MNQAIVAAFMACLNYSPYGLGTETRVTQVYEGPHKQECERIQVEYQREIDAERDAQRRAWAAEDDRAIGAGIAALGGRIP